MPHIIIEHSADFSNDNTLEIGKKIQKIAGEIKEGNFDIDQFKIRAIKYDNFLVGASHLNEANNKVNTATNSFIHVSIKILFGRSLEVRKKLASQSFEFIKKFYDNLNLQTQRCDISLDIIEMDREVYQKITLKK